MAADLLIGSLFYARMCDEKTNTSLSSEPFWKEERKP